MKYYCKERTNNKYGLSVESEGDTSKIGHFYYRVERIINDTNYTYYYYPLDGVLLMCLYFSIDMDDFEKGYRKYQEYFHYAEKTWPLLCKAFIRGIDGDYSKPCIHKFRDFGGDDNRTYAWLLCQKVPYISPREINSDEQFEYACNLIHYANDMLLEVIQNNISKIDRFKINASSLGLEVLKKLAISTCKKGL